MPSVSKMNPEDDPDFQEMQAKGESPESVYLVAKEKFDRMAAIRVIRAIFGLSLESAKEVIVRADGEAASLTEYQERLLPDLEVLSGSADGMKARYSPWQFGSDPAEVTPPHESEVTLTSALALLAELNQLPSELDTADVEAPAWVSFLIPSGVLHLYFNVEPDRITYEYYQDGGNDLCGLATCDVTKEAVRLFFEGQSPRAFLEAHSLELSDNEI
jgi:hypothetical protein